MMNRPNHTLDTALAAMLIALLVSLVLALSGCSFLVGYAIGKAALSLWA